MRTAFSAQLSCQRDPQAKMTADCRPGTCECVRKIAPCRFDIQRLQRGRRVESTRKQRRQLVATQDPGVWCYSALVGYAHLHYLQRRRLGKEPRGQQSETVVREVPAQGGGRNACASAGHAQAV